MVELHLAVAYPLQEAAARTHLHTCKGWCSLVNRGIRSLIYPTRLRQENGIRPVSSLIMLRQAACLRCMALLKRPPGLATAAYPRREVLRVCGMELGHLTVNDGRHQLLALRKATRLAVRKHRLVPGQANIKENGVHVRVE